MSHLAIILIVISAFTHASWNLISKKQNPTQSFFFLANTFGFLFLLPVVILYGHVYLLFPLRVWFLLGGTGFFVALYYAGLSGAYRRGDISIAYPLVRSLPIIIVAIIVFLIAQGAPLSLSSIIGMALIILGCFFLPMKHFKDFKLKNYFNILCLFAFIGAVGTAGYTIIDDRNLRILTHMHNIGLDVVLVTVLYSFMEGAATSFWQLILIGINKNERKIFKFALKTQKKKATITGGMIFFTYTIVLVSMSFVTNVSYVVAFRQLSIPIGAVLGIVLLKESKHNTKLIGIAIILVGLALVALT